MGEDDRSAAHIVWLSLMNNPAIHVDYVMNKYIALALLLCCSAAFAFADVHMQYRRSLDAKALRADSLLVECPSLGIRFVTKDSAFSLLDIVSVPTDVNDLSATHRCDLYSVQGVLLARNVEVPVSAGRQWLSPTYGEVFVVDLHQRQRRAVPTQEVITDVPVVKLTAWRLGYAPSVITVALPEIDTTLTMVLDLLPWWQRITNVQLKISDSLTKRYTKRSWSKNGGGGSQVTDTSNCNLNVHVGNQGSGPRPPLWSVSDTSLQYSFTDNPNSFNCDGIRDVGSMKLDSSMTRVSFLRLSNHNNSSRWSKRDWAATVKDLPPFDVITPSAMSTHCSGKVANGCLVAAGGYVYDDAAQSTSFLDLTEETYTCLHQDQGIYIVCYISLRE